MLSHTFTYLYILTSQEHHQHLGEFPTKGVILHHHLAKLHLHSHVFRGLKGAPVSPHFQESAAAAVAAATSTIEMLLTDYDIREGLVGIPHYLHSMIAFACVFLLKVAAQHPGQYIEDGRVHDLTGSVVQQFRDTAVSKWHLVHLMADGLEKLAASRAAHANNAPACAASLLPPGEHSQQAADLTHSTTANSTPFLAANGGLFEGDGMGGLFEDEFSLGTSSFLSFQPGELDFNFSGFGL